MAKKNKVTLEDMRAEADRRQDNLATDINELMDRVNPKNAASRWSNEAKSTMKGLLRK